jgi:amino acid transporter
MKRNRHVTSIGIVALVVGAVMAGIAAIPGTALSGINPIVLFLIGVVGVFLLGIVLDRAARDALRR